MVALFAGSTFDHHISLYLMKVLITGGTGLVGTAITKTLQKAGHEVAFLSRSPSNNALKVPEFAWDIESGKLDHKALEGVDAIINLAGAPIFKRWTPEYKSEILRSRVDGTRLLFEKVQEANTTLKAFINASAVGYYPDSLTKEFTEDDAPGDDFLSLVCQKWEQEALNFEQLNIRTVRMRIGIVLSREGGALPQMALPVKFGAGAPLGSGKQWVPWIHLADLAKMFKLALENEELSGAVNAAGPNNVTNKSLTNSIAKTLKRPMFLPKVPAFVLKLILGEMAQAVLASNKVSTQKVARAGFGYQFSTVEAALKDLYQK